MQFTFAHNNFNVADLDASLAFYEKALGLREVRRHATDAFTLVYLGDGVTPHQLELTWLADRAEAYDLGENEAMGIYFIADPDGYWLEIVPARK